VQTETKARALQDASVALRAYLVQGLVAQAKGNLADAYPRMRRALFASRASDERALEGEALFYLGVENNFMGRFARAAACARRAYEIKKGLSDRVGEIVSLYLHARAEGGRANYDAALDALEAGHAVSQESRNPFGLAQYPNTRAWLCAELGDWQSAYALDRAGLDLARQAPVRPPEISTLINLVLDCAALDKFAEADAHMLELQKWIGRGEFGFHTWRWQMRFADAHARLLLKRSLCDEARHVVGGLLDWAGRTQSLKYRARGLLLRAQICIRTERRAAEADLVAARDCADVMCYLPARLEARQMLSALHPQQDQHRVEIAQLIADQDRRLKHPDLRRSFERGIARILSQ
jgi:tetratricopeptide (TPR) repeat protein